MKNLPFNKELYVKTLVVVLILMVSVFACAIFFFEYEVTSADPFGSVITSFLLSYLVHLLIMEGKET